MEIRDYIEESMRKLVCRMPYIQLTKSNISDKNIGELEDTIQKKTPRFNQSISNVIFFICTNCYWPDVRRLFKNIL